MASRKTQTKSSTAFLITLNQPEKFETLRDYLLSFRDFNYGVAGEERAPSTGHKHIHIFVQFKKPCRLSISKLCGAHVDKCKGTPQQNRDYVTKNKNIWEVGKMKTKGWLSIINVKEMASNERIQLPLQYYRIVKDIENENRKNLVVSNIKKHVKVYYISGRSGIGKTNFAHNLIGKDSCNIVKYENGFWMGVSNNCRIALYDDWRDNHMKASEFINFIDYNKQIMNVKNGCLLNEYNLIIITSILRLEDIYKNLEYENKVQWIRRIHEIYLCEVKNTERENQIMFLEKKVFIVFKKMVIRRIKIYINKGNFFDK